MDESRESRARAGVMGNWQLGLSWGVGSILWLFLSFLVFSWSFLGLFLVFSFPFLLFSFPFLFF
jgi:hypothetical protein